VRVEYDKGFDLILYLIALKRHSLSSLELYHKIKNSCTLRVVLKYDVIDFLLLLLLLVVIDEMGYSLRTHITLAILKVDKTIESGVTEAVPKGQDVNVSACCKEFDRREGGQFYMIDKLRENLVQQSTDLLKQYVSLNTINMINMLESNRLKKKTIVSQNLKCARL